MIQYIFVYWLIVIVSVYFWLYLKKVCEPAESFTAQNMVCISQTNYSDQKWDL